METSYSSFGSMASLLVTIAVAVYLVYWVFDRLKTPSSVHRALEITPQELGGFRYAPFILISLLGLFVEMMMIRWVSSDIRIFAYFKNFVLIACFLGFGLGCYLCRRRVQLVALIAPLLLLTLILKAPISPLRRSISALPQLLGASVEVHMWGVPALPTSWTGMLLAPAFIVPLFAVIAIAFIPFGQLVGWYLEECPEGRHCVQRQRHCEPRGHCGLHPALLSSSAAMGLVSCRRDFLGHHLLESRESPESAGDLLSDLRGAAGNSRPPSRDHLLVALSEARDPPRVFQWKTRVVSLTTNDSLYQTIVNLSPEFVQAHADVFSRYPVEQNSYNMPYHFYPNPPERCWCWAQAWGTTSAAALRAGAEHVVAVEIDPLIVDLGQAPAFRKSCINRRARATW